MKGVYDKMMSTTVGKIYDLINEYAPINLAYDGDNVGLIIGSRDTVVTGILYAVDVNMQAVDMAKDIGANLIIAHHPVIFEPLRSITDSEASSRLAQHAIREGMSIICAHTNLDAAQDGISYTLAKIAGLKNIYTPDNCSVMRIGEFDEAIETEEFIEHMKKVLNIEVVFITKDYPKSIKTLAVVSGRGCGALYEAIESKVDAFLLGEIKHENAVYANIMDMCVIACGHHETEVIILDKLNLYLQNRLNELQLVAGVYDETPMINL